MTVRERLLAYRRQKRKERMTEWIKHAVRNIFAWDRNDGDERLVEGSIGKDKAELCEESRDTRDTEDAWLQDKRQNTIVTKVIYLLYFLLWITLYMIALEYEFGAVYFVLSALVFIWSNTRSGPKQQGEPSAYSVFNPNCEAIEGTLDASQFEREIRYGIGGAL